VHSFPVLGRVIRKMICFRLFFEPCIGLMYKADMCQIVFGRIKSDRFKVWSLTMSTKRIQKQNQNSNWKKFIHGLKIPFKNKFPIPNIYPFFKLIPHFPKLGDLVKTKFFMKRNALLVRKGNTTYYGMEIQSS